MATKRKIPRSTMPDDRRALPEDAGQRVSPEARRAGRAERIGLAERRRCGRDGLGGHRVMEPASLADPRVEEPVGQVDDEVHEHVQHGNDQGEALDDHVVAAGDRLVDRPADAGQVEDRLGEDGPGQEPAQLQADDGHDRQERVAGGVPQHDRAFAEALRPGRPHVVQAEHLEQAGAGDPGDDGERDRAQGDHRQDEVAQRVAEGAPLAGDERRGDVQPGDEVEHAAQAARRRSRGARPRRAT